MRIFIVGNYKSKLRILFIAISVWLLLFVFCSHIFDNALMFSIVIDPFIEFSYPYGLVIERIFVNEKLENVMDYKSYPPNNNWIISENSMAAFFGTPKPRTIRFTNFKSLKWNFSFDYPSAFVLDEKTFSGGDILYHIDFHDKSNTSHGFLQVWKITSGLNEFLKKSMELSVEIYKYFKSEKIEINGVGGYMWDYAVLSENGFYKGSEVFLKKDGLVYRLSYFVPESKWDKTQSRLFLKMVRSLKIE